MGVVKQSMIEELYHEHLEHEIKECLLAHGDFDVSVIDNMSISFPSEFSYGGTVK